MRKFRFRAFPLTTDATHVAHSYDLRCLDAKTHKGKVCYENKNSHTEDNSPKYRMVGKIILTMRSFACAQDDVLPNKTVYSLFTTHHSLIHIDTVFSRFTSHFSLKRPACATHVAPCDSVGSYFKHWYGAFTLAEVLITLGIIGVVAAMTMPALIANYNNHITEVRLKKFYSIFNQAIQQSVAENGDTSTWDYWFNGEYDNEKNETPEDYSGVLNEKFDRYIAPYMKIVDKKVVNSPKLYKMQLYYLADGSAFGYPLIHNREIYFYPKNAIRCIENIKTIEDNGAICHFAFEFYPNNSNPDWKYLYRKGLEPFLYQWDGDVEKLKTGALYSCNNLNRSGAYCTALIAYNGWKIPKDFPVKIKY